MEKLKLHLGCGEKHLEGFVNIDCRKLESVDVVSDLEKLKKFEDNSAEIIYACHVLEHFSHRKTLGILKEWKRVLKNNGKLFLAVPDFKKLLIRFGLTGRLNSILDPLFGAQNYKSNYHYAAFTFKHLKNILLEAGFKSVKKTKFDFLQKDFEDLSTHWCTLNVVAVK